jgi:hypothetical protein
LEDQERHLDLMDKASEISSRIHRYLPHSSLETPISRWVVFPLVCLLPRDRREEWLGDLYELHQEMLRKKYPRWFVNVVDLCRVLALILSELKIKISDFF